MKSLCPAKYHDSSRSIHLWQPLKPPAHTRQMYTEQQDEMMLQHREETNARLAKLESAAASQALPLGGIEATAAKLALEGGQLNAAAANRALANGEVRLVSQPEGVRGSKREQP
eukprot:3885167-Pyramimonas_sp.AAC.2